LKSRVDVDQDEISAAVRNPIQYGRFEIFRGYAVPVPGVEAHEFHGLQETVQAQPVSPSDQSRLLAQPGIAASGAALDDSGAPEPRQGFSYRCGGQLQRTRLV